MTLSAYADVQQMCALNTPEGLALEFKEKEDATTPELSKLDKRSIAETITAFANSDGGTLVFGIRTAKQQGMDVASEVRPISDVKICRSYVELVCSTNVSPGLKSLSTYAIENEANAGVIVCTVETSELRPHMCTAQGVHRYLRRGFEGNALMTPSDVKDQILAVRDAVLEPVVSYPAGTSFSPADIWLSIKGNVVFSLKNIGKSVCRNPFLRVHADCDLHSHSATFDGALGMWKTTFPWGTFIHVDDQQTCLNVSFNGLVRFDILSQLFAGNRIDLTEAVFVFPGRANYQVDTITDKTSLPGIEFHVSFGAENAAVVQRSVTFSRRELAQGVFKHPQVASSYMQSFGGWRKDLVDQFIQST